MGGVIPLRVRSLAAPRPSPELAAPQGLVVTRLDVGADSFAVLEWPLPRVLAPAVLTPAEKDVVHLLLEGLTNARIARALHRSRNTVANQIASAYRKLGVGSRAELAARAVTTSAGDER